MPGLRQRDRCQLMVHRLETRPIGQRSVRSSTLPKLIRTISAPIFIEGTALLFTARDEEDAWWPPDFLSWSISKQDIFDKRLIINNSLGSTAENEVFDSLFSMTSWDRQPKILSDILSFFVLSLDNTRQVIPLPPRSPLLFPASTGSRRILTIVAYYKETVKAKNSAPHL